MAQRPQGGVDGDRAVSPVIGVILMVAVTVVLGAVIGGFVLGGFDTGEPAPAASLAVVDADENLSTNPGYTNGPRAFQDVLVIEHRGGDTLSTDNLNVTLSNETEPVAVYAEGENYDPNIGPATGGLTERADYGVYNVSGDPGELAVGGEIRLVENQPPGFGPPYAVLEIPDGTYRILIVHVPSDTVLVDRRIVLE